MSKSIKPKNNVYLDSTGVVHNRTSLKDLLNNLESSISTLNTNLSNLSNIVTSLRNIVTVTDRLVGANLNNAKFKDGLTYLYNPVNSPAGSNGFILQFSWDNGGVDSYGIQFNWAWNGNKIWFRTFGEGNYFQWNALN